LIGLIKRLDRLADKNNDIFAKAYFRLHVTAFPLTAALVSGYVSGGLSKRGMEWLNEGNDLLQLVN
jgi:hypothetical protein